MSSRIERFLGDGIEESFDPELKRAFDVDDNEVPQELKKRKCPLDKEHFRVSMGFTPFRAIFNNGQRLLSSVCNLRCVL